MARRESDSNQSSRGYNDVIGITLIAIGMLLMVAQWSYDSWDLRIIHDPPNSPVKNWIGTVGAHFAYYSFRIFGAAAYVLPLLFYFLDFQICGATLNMPEKDGGPGAQLCC